MKEPLRPDPVREMPLRIGGVLLDEADSEQTRREKLARIVLDEMYQFVGLLDAEGRVLEINRAALRGAGLRLEDIRGTPFWQARWFQVSQENVAATQDYVRRARAGEFIRCDMEVYGEAAGDHTIVVDFSLLPVKDEAGRVVLLLAEGRNISAKKQVEAELARRNAELQRLLDRITELDQLKSDFFANVSHELRTPLTLILGPTEELLAAADNLSERQRDQLRVVQRSAHALLRHVGDLLDLARLDSGKTPMHYAPCDLAVVVRAAAEEFHAVAPARRIAYRVDVPDGMTAQVDPEKIERVLLNLLSNAFKFTPPGGRILCRLARSDDGRALLSVQDSGPGVPPGSEQAIFERFRQVQQGTTREHGGTGLGLAIAKEFVDLHRGAISVSPAPGGGALFQVEIPLEAPAGTELTPPHPARPDESRKAAPAVLAGLVAGPDDAPSSVAEPDLPSRPRVLLVEDNPDVSRFVREALGAEFRVATVDDGAKALERLVAQPPDLLITDLMLPGLGGDRLVEAMRARVGLQDLPVLVLSARGDTALRSRLLSESVQDYLTKPFSAPELRARVRNLVSVKLARDQMQRALETQGRDLTQLTRTLIANQGALKESEQRWWAIYEHSPVGIALIDGDDLVRTANPAFRRMLGYGAEEIRGCSLERLTLVEDRAAMRRRIAALRSGESREVRMQRRFHRRDGSVVWANASVAPIPPSGTAEPMLVLVTEDITEQKRAEDSLARTRSELARVGRASSLGELAASIAHEVNQPLAAVAANGHACLRWLDARPPNEHEVRLAVERIIRDANRAGDVIARIRNFLRRVEPTRQGLPIRTVIDEVLGMIRAEAHGQGVALQVQLDDGLPPVAGDAVQLQQVVLNLVMNALESIARAGRSQNSVTIGTCRHDESALRVDVRDSGGGLDADAPDRIFEAFYTTKPEGMGMGLAIAHSIVEAHGGRLWVTPNADAGVTFHFTVPFETTVAGDEG